MADDELKNFEADFGEATKLPTTIKESAIRYQPAEDMLKSGQAVTIDDFLDNVRQRLKDNLKMIIFR